MWHRLYKISENSYDCKTRILKNDISILSNFCKLPYAVFCSDIYASSPRHCRQRVTWKKSDMFLLFLVTKFVRWYFWSILWYFCGNQCGPVGPPVLHRSFYYNHKKQCNVKNRNPKNQQTMKRRIFFDFFRWFFIFQMWKYRFWWGAEAPPGGVKYTHPCLLQEALYSTSLFP